jgi:hypothetical protein
MVAGAISGFIAQTITYPLDVVRRRMQTDGLVKGLPPLSAKILQHEPSITIEGIRRYGSMIGTIEYIYVTEGIRGFFKGVSLNWIKGPLSVAISFTTYDTLKALFLVDSTTPITTVTATTITASTSNSVAAMTADDVNHNSTTTTTTTSSSSSYPSN